MRLRNVWSVILATDDQKGSGDLAAARQYLAPGGQPSLLQQAVERGRALTDLPRISAVVRAEHRPFWEDQLDVLPREQIVVQPRDRGTAAAVLLPLLRIAQKDPEAIVLTLPADHAIADQEVVIRAMEAAVEGVQCQPDKVVLLGMKPEDAGPEHSWVVPSRRKQATGTFLPVDSFIDRPSDRFAQIIYNRGGLWSSLIFASTVFNLLQIYQICLPELYRHFKPFVSEDPWNSRSLETLFRKAPPRDFSCDVLECCERLLGVIPVQPCGWTDFSHPGQWAVYQQSLAASGGAASLH